MLLPSGTCDRSVAEATAVTGEGSLNASPPSSVQSKAGELKPSPLDGWEKTPGAWQRI